MTAGTLAITMAGFGRRFADAGHTRPKYELAALDRPLFDWSMAGLAGFLDAGWHLRLAARAGEGAREFIMARAAVRGRPSTMAKTSRVSPKKANSKQPRNIAAARP